MTTAPTTPATDTSDPGRRDLLAAAQNALANFHTFTEQVTAKLDTEVVMPQTEARWRQQQDTYLEIARTHALVSIAAQAHTSAGRDG